jgi:toxin FitB
LLDTNVVSELRRPRPRGAVVAWLHTVPDSGLYVSAVTIGELQAGIELTRDRDPKKAAEIESWLEQVAETYSNGCPDISILGTPHASATGPPH